MTELGNLSQCMVDSDPEAIVRARRLRRKAILISIAIEAICLAALLIWPLITPGVLPAMYITTPLPPYRGGAGAKTPQQTHRPQRNPGPQIIRDPFRYEPPRPTTVVRQFADDSAPDIGPAAGVGSGAGLGSGPTGPVIQGGSPDGMRVEPPREPASTRPAMRQKKSEGVMESALIHRVDPKYPEIARAMHLSGEVRLRAIIATDGSIQHLEVLSGSPILAQAAKEAVSQWRYRPTLLSGAPVEVETYITVNFILGRE